MNTSNPSDWSAELRDAVVNMLLAAADDDLMIGHAASEWTGLAPMLEEDIAMSSIAQDEIAHAREIYTVVAELTKRTPDEQAYGRPPQEYRCCDLVLRSDEFDWASLIARQFYYDQFAALQLRRWSESQWRVQANLAHRIGQEKLFHVHHTNDWLRRLGAAKTDARDRMQRALNDMWPLASGLFEEVPGIELAKSNGLYPELDRPMADAYLEAVQKAVTDAGLSIPVGGLQLDKLPAGGRNGVHASNFTEVLDELCEVYRLEPDAAW